MIYLKKGEYYKMSKNEAEAFFENDAESLDILRDNPTAEVYLFTDGKWAIQSAIVSEGENPASIDRWEEDYIADCTTIIQIIE